MIFIKKRFDFTHLKKFLVFMEKNLKVYKDNDMHYLIKSCSLKK
jgi:hypothetical protein